MSDASTQIQPVPSSEDVFVITEAAAEHIRETLKDTPEYGIRLGVVGGGCAGLQYQIVPCEAPSPKDIIQEAYGIQFFVNPLAKAYLKGIHIDYKKDLVDGGLKISNPNAASSCGCGTSFGV